MVKNKYVLIFLIAITPNLLNAMAVKNIEIKNVGITVTKIPGEGEINACKKFQPNKNQLIEFLNHLKNRKKINGYMNITLHVYQPGMLNLKMVYPESGFCNPVVLAGSSWIITIQSIFSGKIIRGKTRWLVLTD